MHMRYDRNKPLISDDEQTILGSCTAAVVGLGGLGGTIAVQMTRLGFGKLLLIDNDNIEQSNLNRQAFATEDSVGITKTEAALKRLRSVSSFTEYHAQTVRLDDGNASELLSGADIVMDALDNVPSRRALRRACKELGLPMVHGAIGSWYGQISFFAPDDDTFDILYPTGADKLEATGNPAFTPALVASIQVAQAVKWRLRKGGLLSKSVLYVDMLSDEYEIVKF